ncbi:MAG: MASE1 domain-containing protein [Ectothiorhodospiraceae bacterium]|nr:MASE1 domain-containing protein [Ectothiorhodospiraceae bacterium]
MAVLAERMQQRWPMRDWKAHAGMGLLYLLLTVWSLDMRLEEPPVPMVWPATGVLLAYVYHYGYRLAISGALFGVLAQFQLGAGPMDALVLGAAGGAAAMAGARLLRATEFGPRLQRIRDGLLLLAVGALASALISAVLGGLVLAGLSSRLPEVFGLCLLADFMGMLILSPVLMTMLRRPRGDFSLNPEGWALLLLAPGIALAVYSLDLPFMMTLPASYALFPVLMYAAIRQPPWLVALLILLVAGVALHCTALGGGPFAQSGMRHDLLSMHAQVAMLALTGLLLAALRAERQAAENAARQHLSNLARAGRLNAMSTLAAGIAHEVNQPLCAVNSYAQAARRMVERDEGGQPLREALDRIVSGTERASDIVRRTRGYLREESAQHQPQQLNALIEEALALLGPELRRQQVTLKLDLAPGLPTVLASGIELHQVVVNLVQNAVEAMGVSRSPEQRWVGVQTRLSAGGDAICLRVSDNGPGLPPGDRRALFEPLFGSRPQGTGMGLCIVRSIVDAHHGRLEANNLPGAGACFHIRLPVTGEALDG